VLSPSVRRRTGFFHAPGEPAGSAQIVGLGLAWGLEGGRRARSGEPGLYAELGIALLALGRPRRFRNEEAVRSRADVSGNEARLARHRRRVNLFLAHSIGAAG
jgi:hypothetical protein